MWFPYPVPVADIAEVLVGILRETAGHAWEMAESENCQVVRAYQEMAVVALTLLAVPDHIAMHSMVFVVLVAPEVVGVVVALRFPMFRSIY